jgi:hypothetical protein
MRREQQGVASMDLHSERNIGSANLQAARLETLILAAASARPAAGRGLLFASHPGRALVNAAFDLFECDELYRLRQDVEHEIGIGDRA